MSIAAITDLAKVAKVAKVVKVVKNVGHVEAHGHCWEINAGDKKTYERIGALCTKDNLTLLKGPCKPTVCTNKINHEDNHTTTTCVVNTGRVLHSWS